VVSEPVPDPIAQNHDEYIDLHERDDANLEAAAEQAAARNNAEADILAIPPPRRSTRTRRAPEIFITDNTSTREARPEQVTNNCRNMKHKGLGCAALDANHYPDYYDSLKNVILFLIVLAIFDAISKPCADSATLFNWRVNLTR
jgi:hypothetical protein